MFKYFGGKLKRRLLIVEDEITNQELLKSLAEFLDYEIVDIVDNAEDTFQVLDKKEVDLVSMDIYLNGNRDGIDISKEIMEKYDVPLVFITASEDEETIQKALNVSPYGYLIKPFKKMQAGIVFENAILKHKSEKRYKYLINNIKNAVFIYQDSKVIFLNKTFKRKLGYSIEEINDGDVKDIIHPGDYKFVMKNQKSRFNNEIETTNDYNIRVKPKGEKNYRIFNIKTSEINYNNEPSIIGIMEDVTTRIQSEIELRKSQEHLKIVTEKSNVGLGLYEKGKIKYISNFFKNIFGKYAIEKIVQKPEKIYELVDEKDHELLNKLHVNNYKNESDLDDKVILRAKDKNGRMRWIEVSVKRDFKSDNSLKRVVVICRDITEEKEKEIAYENLLASSLQGVLIIQDKDIIFVNEAVKNITQYDFYKFSSMKLKDILVEIDANVTKELTHKYKKWLNSKDNSIQMQLEFSKQEGNYGCVQLLFTKVDYKGKEAQLVTFIDITQMKKNEIKLRENEKKYRGVFENSGTALVIFRDDRVIKMCNSEFEYLSGYSKNEIENMMKWDRFIHEDDYEKMLHLHKERSKNKQLPSQYEFKFIDRYGNIKNILLRLKLIPSTNERIASLLDITELKKIQEERARYQKLESIGTLAGGIAHDMNNQLMAILGNISILKMILNENNLDLAPVVDSEQAIKKAKKLANQLLTFAKGGSPIIKTESIGNIIKDSADFVLSGSDIMCHYKIQDDLWKAKVDKEQISQVIQNIVINAHQSIEDRGTIEIKAENLIIENDTVPTLKGGNYIKISITDNGHGIPDEHLKKIFDPFFTTKNFGSGLGLSISYSIINRHKGFIKVDSKLEEGTTFYIYLPAEILEKDKDHSKAVKKNKTNINKKESKALILDDDKMVLNVATKLLEHLDFVVESSLQSDDAISKFEMAAKKGNSFDLVIIDLTIPGDIDAVSLLNKLKNINSDFSAIISSGYVNDPLMIDYKEHGFDGAIAKPYDFDKISKLIKNIMEE